MAKNIIIVKIKNDALIDTSLFGGISLDLLLENNLLEKNYVAQHWIDKWEKIREKKNEVVRNQQYEEAASLRDWERSLIDKIFKEYTPDGLKIARILSKNETDVYLAASSEVLWALGYDERPELI